ncbi:MAG: hypothetical protein ACNS63_01985 [Candidatus Nitrospinota bacterium M3_3B_026]|jgi:hypothetical protein
MLARRKVLFLSSKDRISGSKGDFRVDIADAIDDTDNAVPVHVRSRQNSQRVEGVLTQLYVPFRPESDGRIPRFPAVIDPATGQPPVVHMLKFHTDVPHENDCVGGCTSMVAQIPFMRNFEESKDGSVFFSAFVYEEQHGEGNGRFTLTHGLRALKHARFWVTDELDRLILPAADIFFGLVLEIYTWDPLITSSGLSDRVARRTDQLAHLARLQFLRGEGVAQDPKPRRALGFYRRDKRQQQENGNNNNGL